MPERIVKHKTSTKLNKKSKIKVSDTHLLPYAAVRNTIQAFVLIS